MGIRVSDRDRMMCMLEIIGLYVRASIMESLNQGKTLIVDRYAYSGVVFTAAKVSGE